MTEITTISLDPRILDAFKQSVPPREISRSIQDLIIEFLKSQKPEDDSFG